MSFSTNLISKEPIPEMSNVKASDLAQDPMLIYSTTGKLASQNVPDSPPTMFISANSSPGCNIVNERDDAYSNLSNFYSIFSRITEMKNKEMASNSYFPNGGSTSNNTGLGAGFSSCSPATGAQLLPPSLVNNSQSNNSNSFNSLSVDEGSLKSKVDSSNSLFPYPGSQIEWNNTMNAYYQQLALYNQMAMAMYSPILAGGYGIAGTTTGCFNPLLRQMYLGWQGNNSALTGQGSRPGSGTGIGIGIGIGTGIGTGTGTGSGTGTGTLTGSGTGTGSTLMPFNLFELQNGGSQAPNMVSLASLSQIPCNGGALGANLTPTANIIGGSESRLNIPSVNLTGGVSSSSISVNSSPIHSSQTIPSILSPISKSQSSNSRKSLNNFDGGFEISNTLGDWVSKIGLRQESRKAEKSRKSIKSNIGGRRKIDKSSAICIVCGTTQTSQWRFLNLGELYSSNKDEHSISLKQESNHAFNAQSDQISSTPETSPSSNIQPTTYVEKQICCNACYMKYDRNRPRYRNGKKVPPPLPPYLYSQNQCITASKPKVADNHSKYKQEASYTQSE
ncbi:unnamed protein product [Cryptosporidium hominis]|uniref:GATA-type domain-containing protein n=1 Tax=Cryptosporidium hominis TaxID=237895 RepID=A0A0S4TEP3_CRYHO|nr:hypothetical protein [Cryptosporidium hominis TU502]OLQ18279.1 hypothetical protein ChTU502y2012_408g0310 [Cryptosporidium hominis]PPA63080.1 hypothetical protein ChUKH1_11150 [Cryptosporidium hominis]CUV05744.1 unnamed protein product [Cryptosporidium hominis]